MMQLLKKKSALSIQGLTVNYNQMQALTEVSLDVPPGKLVGIIGPNGAGKSTLIRSALGFVKPIAGKIEFFGKPLKEMKRHVAYVPQRGSVDWDFPVSVMELVLMGRYGKLGIFRRPKKEDYALAKDYLQSVEMLPYAERQISQLSVGQQQRVFLARALIQEADIYFMDEPFAGIDAASEKILMDLLRGMIKQGKTVFIVHHDLCSVGAYFDWVIVLNRKLVACGSTKDTFHSQALQSAYGKNFNFFREALTL